MYKSNNNMDRSFSKRPERQIYRPPGLRSETTSGLGCVASSGNTASGTSRPYSRKLVSVLPRRDPVDSCVNHSSRTIYKPHQAYQQRATSLLTKNENASLKPAFVYYNNSNSSHKLSPELQQRPSKLQSSTTHFIVKVDLDNQEKPLTLDQTSEKTNSVVQRSKLDSSAKIDTCRSSDIHEQTDSKSSNFNTSDSNLIMEKQKVSTNPSGGLLRLNNESMKLLNEELKKDDDKAATTKPMVIDFYAIHGLVEKLNSAIRLATSKLTLDHKETLIHSYRMRLLSKLEQVLKHDLKGANDHNAIQTIWQSGFYAFIKYYRDVCKGTLPTPKSQTSCNQTKRATELYWSLIDEGIEYFETLKTQLYTHHHFSYGILLERRKHYDLNLSLFSQLQDGVQAVKQILIYLGDLARYRDSARTNYENPKGYYLKAHMLVPRNIHVCTQIAMISFYQKNYFDSTYYYIRSFDLECSMLKNIKNNASNKYNLTIIFDEIQNNFRENAKSLLSEFKKLPRDSQCKEHDQKENGNTNGKFRIEYWIRPDNFVYKWDMYNFFDLAVLMSKEARNDLLHVYKHRLVKMYSFKELKSRFIVSFLAVHGLLNCRESMDNYNNVANQMLIEFEALLNYCKVHDDQPQGSSNNTISSLFLVKLIAINIYTITNTMTAEDKDKNATEYTFAHLNAYFIMSTMVCMILRRLIAEADSFTAWHEQMLAEGSIHEERRVRSASHLSTDSSDQLLTTFLDDTPNKSVKSHSVSLGFFTLLPCIKIWSDWVITCKPRFPPQDMNILRIDFQENQWHFLAQLMTVLNKIKEFPVKFYCDDSSQNLQLIAPKSDNYELVQLPEDRCLEGYSPLSEAPESAKYTKLSFIPEIAHTYMRIASLQLYGDYLCGLDNPYLRFNPKLQDFQSLIESDDVEGLPGLKLGQVEERKFLETLQKYKQIKDDEQSDLTDEDEDLTRLSESEGLSDDDAIRQIRNLDVGPVERRKLINYRLFRRIHPTHGRYYKIIEHEEQHKIRFVIQPRYVVFDTNCLLQEFEQIKTMINSAPFTVTIPLIVISELDYIINREKRVHHSESPIDNLLKSLSVKNKENIEINEEIVEKAKTVLAYIRDSIGKSSNRLKTVTTKGSVLDSMDFKEELYDSHFCADDSVLYACVNLVNEGQQTSMKMREQLEKLGEKIGYDDKFIHRNVVLITDDKNLRLKSLGYDIPAKKMSHFLKWAIPTMHTCSSKPSTSSSPP